MLHRIVATLLLPAAQGIDDVLSSLRTAPRPCRLRRGRISVGDELLQIILQGHAPSRVGALARGRRQEEQS